MKKNLFVLAILLAPLWVSAQEVSNVRAERSVDNVIIYYDLKGPSAESLFEVNLFGSHNNFTEPLKLVSGDIGTRINPGPNKQVIWKAKEELVNYRGEIIFEIRATVLGGYYMVNNPSAASSFKRGKLMPINWTGGASGENVKLELLKDDTRTTTISESTSNQGSFIWTIPKGLKTGKGYQVKVSNTRNYEQQGVSKTFKLKKFPVGITVFLGAAAIGGALYAAGIFGGGDDGDGGGGTIVPPPPPTDDPLPLPPSPPGG